MPRPIKPRMFGPYRLIAQIASGGMGTVYLAEQPTEPKLVAVKRIHEHMAEQPRFRRMFADETRIAARIDHPNVCGVIAFGEIEDTPYLVMPFLRGRPLSEVMKKLRERGPSRETTLVMARIAMDVCTGLHAAHELEGPGGNLEVVHRDVSPHNLFVGYDGVTRLLDFGVASAREKLASTASGEVKGKLAYMAPENLDGAGIDRRADVWSLGVVLWESIAGEKLFGSESMGEVVNAILSGPIASLSEYSMEVPLGLEEVVFRALARDRDSRFPSAAAMREELLIMFEDEGVMLTHDDVAIWMAALFPGGERETGQFVAAALEERHEDVTPVEPITLARMTPAEGRDRTFPSFIPQRPRWWLPWAAASASVAALVAFSIVRTRASDPTEDVLTPVIAPLEHDAGGYTFELPPVGDMAGMDTEDPTMGAEPVGEDPAMSMTGVAPRTMDTMRSMRMAMTMRARGRGTLNVVTPGGWGIVFTRGRRLGEAPGSFQLSAGTHRIEVRPFGRGAPIRRRVTIRDGATSRVRVPVR